eukprot:6196222-Pleurochrysis_carterae.AAC.1
MCRTGGEGEAVTRIERDSRIKWATIYGARAKLAPARCRGAGRRGARARCAAATAACTEGCTGTPCSEDRLRGACVQESRCRTALGKRAEMPLTLSLIHI